jgi:hypothetical protein
MHFLPQPGDTRSRCGTGIVLTAAFALGPVIEQAPRRISIAVVFPLLFVTGRQTLSFDRFADGFIHPVDVQRSIEYRSAKWVEENLPGERVMMGGSLGNFLNVFTQVPQLSAQPYTTAPNWEEQIAVYTIYRGEDAGERDGEHSLLC